MRALIQTHYDAPGGGGPRQRRRIFLDVGANIGWFTFLWASYNVPTIAIEAMQYNFGLLERTLHENPRFVRLVRAYRTIIGARAHVNSEACIHFHETSGRPNRGNGEVVPVARGEFDCGRVRTFAELALYDAAFEHIFAMKIDVEGFEVHFFDGSEFSDEELPCYVYIEIDSHGKTRAQIDPRGRSVREWLLDHGYEQILLSKDDYLFVLSSTSNPLCPADPKADKRIISPPALL